jgi:aconitase A
MMRGTFANTRIKNEMLGGKEGGFTVKAAGASAGEEMPIYDACMKYKAEGTPLMVSSPVRNMAQVHPVTGRPRAHTCLA